MVTMSRVWENECIVILSAFCARRISPFLALEPRVILRSAQNDGQGHRPLERRGSLLPECLWAKAGLVHAEEKKGCPVRLRRTGRYKGYCGFPVRADMPAVDCQLTTAGAASSAPTRAPGTPAFPVRERPGPISGLRWSPSDSRNRRRTHRGRRPLQMQIQLKGLWTVGCRLLTNGTARGLAVVGCDRSEVCKADNFTQKGCEYGAACDQS